MNTVPEPYEESATFEYLKVIRQHVIQPLEATALGESCFAAAMLIFAAVDGLGKLTHPDDRAKAGERFKSFLPRLGAQYTRHARRLWELRNQLDHSAINVACFMSKTQDAEGEHLEWFDDHLF